MAGEAGENGNSFRERIVPSCLTSKAASPWEPTVSVCGFRIWQRTHLHEGAQLEAIRSRAADPLAWERTVLAAYNPRLWIIWQRTQLHAPYMTVQTSVSTDIGAQFCFGAWLWVVKHKLTYKWFLPWPFVGFRL